VAEQIPVEQTCPAAHVLPHAPQFFGSTLVSAHVPDGHAVKSSRHWHLPARQCWPSPHWMPQAPQFSESKAGSEQPVMQPW